MAENVPPTGITVTRKAPGGRVPGVKVQASPEQIAANRVRNWKHGKYAKTASPIEKRAADFEAIAPGFLEVAEGYVEALNTGSLEQPNMMAALSMAEAEFRRRRIADRITKDGEAIEESMFDKDGNEIGQRLRAHPLLEHERALARDLGHTATDMQLTRKSRGEGAKDEAMTAALRRDALLRSMPKDAMVPPPDEGENE